MTAEIAKPSLTKSRAMTICEQVRANIGGVADLLVELHAGQGWAVLGYLTWKECCEKEFQHSAWWAGRQLRIAEVRKSLPPKPGGRPRGKSTGSTPQKDSHLTELGKVAEEQRQAVLDWATEKADGKPLTAAVIRQAAEDVLEAVTEEEEPEPPTVEQCMEAANAALRSLSKRITDLIGQAGNLDNPHLTDEKHGRMETLKAQLRSAAGTVRSAIGAGTCTYCEGIGCKHCLKTGWLTKAALESAPEKVA